jgi:hypothetical protein
MEFKNEQNILDRTLKDFENKHKLLSLWIAFKVRLKLFLLNLTNKH